MGRQRDPLRVGKHAFLNDHTPANYFRAWRLHRRMSLQQVADVMETFPSAVSKYELGDIPYSQRVLELLAEIYRCRPSDLLAGPPAEAEKPIHDLRELPQETQDQILELLNQAASRLKKS
jgi:transcriptional regulator with XRE-family HTH domain